MKRIFQLLLIFGTFASMNAQDLIIWKNGTRSNVLIVETTHDKVAFKHFDQLSGPVYNVHKSEIKQIRYADGSEETYQYQPVSSSGEFTNRPSRIRYSGLVEAGISPGYDFYNNYFSLGASLNTAHGIMLKDRYFFGMGTGIHVEYLSYFEKSYVYLPFYTTARIDFSDKDIRSFISFSAGFQIGLSNDTFYDFSMGWWFNTLLGIRFKNGWYLSAGPCVKGAQGFNDSWYYHESFSETIYSSVGLMACFGRRF
ncbi:MAG: hypothetical protein LBQ60_11860 [Bacteroidales bacterium]|jgi:hypothetical protein|nr:hypothetical protein [Bacteroidales bacterium]